MVGQRAVSARPRGRGSLCSRGAPNLVQLLDETWWVCSWCLSSLPLSYPDAQARCMAWGTRCIPTGLVDLAGPLPEPLLSLLASLSLPFRMPLLGACCTQGQTTAAPPCSGEPRALAGPASFASHSHPGKGGRSAPSGLGTSPSGLQAVVCSSLNGPRVACPELELVGVACGASAVLVGAWSFSLPPKQHLLQESA